MIKVIDEKPVPRATVVCNSCGSTLEYGNADLWEHKYESNYNLATNYLVEYHFQCPVCGCKVNANWIERKEQ